MPTAFSTRTRDVRARDVREIDEFLEVFVRDLDPDAVPLNEVTDLWSAFDAVERSASAAKTLLARRVEEAGAWKRAGFRSAAEQLAGLSGTSVSAAKNEIQTSKRVRKLPKTANALREGKLSGAKAQAIAAAADVAPAAEDSLLELAERAPLAEVQRECLEARAGDDRDAAHERIRSERTLREYTDAEGAWNLYARGTLDDALAFRAAHGPMVDELFNQAREEGRREAPGAYAFDALILLARRAANPAAESEGEAPEAAPTAKARTKPTPSRHLGIIRIDHMALRRGSVEGDEICDIPGLGPIPVSVARRLLGDAILKLVVTNGVDVMNVTHLGRSVTVAQQVALWWQSPVCTEEHCTRTQRLENDHREDWVETHHTRLDETDPLCDHHHDLKTHRGWALVGGTGTRPMVPPDDPRHPKNRPR